MPPQTGFSPFYVEIWADFSCPFCYIGKRNFFAAAQELNLLDKLTVVYRSFLLDPELSPLMEGEKVKQYLSISRGLSAENIDTMMGHVSELADQCGVECKVHNSVVANTRRAHMLLHLAQSQGKADACVEALYQVNFVHNQHLNKDHILTDCAVQCGITPEELEAALRSNEFQHQIDEDLRLAADFGIRSVPFFVFGRRQAVSGTQPMETFKSMLQNILLHSPES